MHAVIFEVWPKEEGRQEYLDIAAALKPTLEKMDGFISIERFQSLTDPAKILSLSFWRDDAAIAAWRAVVRRQTPPILRSGTGRAKGRTTTPRA